MRYRLTIEFDTHSDNHAESIAEMIHGSMPMRHGLELLREDVRPWLRTTTVSWDAPPMRSVPKAVSSS